MALQASSRQMRPGRLSASLGLLDSVNIIVGIVVGVSIFRVSPVIFNNVADPWQGLGAWLLGGILSIIGALCYAELATTYPRMGGDYVYLTRAYRPWTGFLFGWGRLSVIQTGSIGSMAYIFADYAVDFFSLPVHHTVWLAAACVLAVTAINLFGIVAGKTAQNILTVLKVAGLLGIMAAGMLLFQSAEAFAGAPLESPVRGPGFGLAMILVLYAYGGWNDAAFVAAETREPKRNIPRALLLSVGGITVFYLLINLAYLMGLGFDGLRETHVPAAAVLGGMLGPWGSRAMSLLVMLSVLGAINGTALTGARVHVAMGRDHRLFAWLGRWDARKHAPAWALLVQAGIALLMIVGVGTAFGRAVIDRIMRGIGFSGLPWENYGGGFETLVTGTAPVFWLFFLLTGVALFVLRWREPERPRPFSVPFYPVIPLIFCGTCVYMLYSSLTYAQGLSLFGLVPLALGIPLYGISRRQTGGRNSEQ